MTDSLYLTRRIGKYYHVLDRRVNIRLRISLVKSSESSIVPAVGYCY